MTPESAGDGMPGSALDVAVAIAVNLGTRAGSADERVVLGNAPVVMQAYDATEMVAEVLRRRHPAAVAQGEVEIAGAVEDETSAEMERRIELGLHAEDGADIGHPVTDQAAAQHLGAGTCVVRSGIR